MIRATFAALALISAGSPALAQDAPPAHTPSKIRNVMLAPGEKCPAPSSADEVVVCGNLEDRYRIPKELRNVGPIAPERQSWAAKQAVADDVGREAGGLPNTCSPVGSGGQTGCTQLMLQRAREDQRQRNGNPPR